MGLPSEAFGGRAVTELSSEVASKANPCMKLRLRAATLTLTCLWMSGFLPCLPLETLPYCHVVMPTWLHSQETGKGSNPSHTHSHTFIKASVAIIFRGPDRSETTDPSVLPKHDFISYVGETCCFFCHHMCDFKHFFITFFVCYSSHSCVVKLLCQDHTNAQVIWLILQRFGQRCLIGGKIIKIYL